MSSPLTDQTPVPVTYARSAPPPLRAPALEGSMQADVAVVGAGYTGLSTALHLAEAGVSTVVLEAQEVGWGGSGRAFGQVVPYAKHDHGDVLRTFGPDYGERLIDALGAGPDYVFSLIEKHGIACEPVRQGLLFAAHTAAAAVGLEKKAEFLQTRGAPVAFLDAPETERMVGSRYYRAALFEKRGGTLNPLGYVRGLGHAAVKTGVRLFEQSRATGLTREGKGWIVRTDRGQVTAEAVVLATDAYTDNLWPGLRSSVIPLRAYQIASAPLTDNLRRSVLPGGQSLTDTRRLYSGIRVRADGRLHLSVDGPAFSTGGRASAAKATRRVREIFPQLGDLEWQEQVAGWVGMTQDQYPHLHRLADGVFAAIGLSGRGIAFGTLLGREVSKRILGRPEAEFVLPLTPLRPIRVQPFARPLVGSLLNWYRLLDRIDLHRAYLRTQG